MCLPSYFLIMENFEITEEMYQAASVDNIKDIPANAYVVILNDDDSVERVVHTKKETKIYNLLHNDERDGSECHEDYKKTNPKDWSKELRENVWVRNVWLEHQDTRIPTINCALSRVRVLKEE